MTRKSFYRKLRKIAPNFRWMKRGTTIRAYDKNENQYCPITAVANRPNMVDDTLYIGQVYLDMNDENIARIVNSSDSSFYSLFSFFPREEQKHRACRKTLLRCVGLE